MSRRPRPGDAEREAEATLFAELEAFYREVDARFAGHTCPASAECCHFFTTGREPYVTSLELAYLERAAAARGGRLGPHRPAGGRRKLPVARDATWVCPLHRGGRCSVYAARPLGCRTYFCERASADRPVRQQEINAFVRRLKELSEKHRPGGEEGRPLTRVLAGG